MTSREQVEQERRAERAKPRMSVAAVAMAVTVFAVVVVGIVLYLVLR